MAINISKQSLSLLVSLIKQKRELSGLKDDLVLKELNKYLNSNPKVLSKINKKSGKNLQRSSIFKETMKSVRKTLHKTHGVFQTKKVFKRGKLLEKLKISVKDSDFMQVHKELLKTNVSSRERLGDYEELYEHLFSITSKPKSLLDLGSGINPLSFPLMHLGKLDYLSTEINQSDIDFINEYFLIMSKYGLTGKAIFLDLSDEEALITLQKISQKDICFMFKLLESLNLVKKKKYKLIEKILSSTKSRWIVVSFATKTISGKSMKFKQRNWMDLMLNRLHLKYEKFNTSNEIFYIIKNH